MSKYERFAVNLISHVFMIYGVSGRSSRYAPVSAIHPKLGASATTTRALEGVLFIAAAHPRGIMFMGHVAVPEDPLEHSGVRYPSTRGHVACDDYGEPGGSEPPTN
uniref:Uncharacterized protein n=1 Tax=Arundo donax TaxID=35708 RepID=A0A0A9FF44_ARUDO